MFQRARLKLTVWYLLIIMLISLSFSAFIYNVLTFEFNRILQREQLRREGQLPTSSSGFFLFRDDMPRRGIRIAPPNPEVIQEAKNRLGYILGLINLGIFAIAGASGYFLAGKTLRPIKEMVDEQNRFITDASHELRTPLTSLKSEIEVNLRDKDLNIKQAKKLLESNLEEVNNLQSLSDGLIKLAQYQKANGIVLDKVNLSDISKEAIRKVINLAKHNKIAIKNSIKDFIIEADKQKLTEMLVVFLDNAIKYSPSNTTVTLSCEKHENSVVIDIKDQGIGIEKDEIQNLFDRFYRGDRSRSKQNIEGYGLGLSIAKQIVDKHKGSIKVDSEVNKGTTFSVYLPIKNSPGII